MKKQVLFIQGGGEGAYEVDGKLVESLQAALGDEYDVRYPKMPEEDDAGYELWKARISKELAALDSEVILVAHSVGSSILLKYLSEARIDKSLAGVFLIAAPYWGPGGWQMDGFTLDEARASRLLEAIPIFFYHCRDDEVVPFAHLALHTKEFPQAIIREFDGRGHQFNNDLSEVATDIKSLQDMKTTSKNKAARFYQQASDLPRLSQPAYRALAGAGIQNLQQLTKFRETEIKKLHGMGPKALSSLRQALAEKGLSFAEEKRK